MKPNYPPKPWTNGMRYMIIPGMEFLYSASTKKWVPVTPGYENEEQLQDSFGVSTIVELAEIFKKESVKIAEAVATVQQYDTAITTVQSSVVQLDSDVRLSGRIWKTSSAPSSPNPNDIWVDAGSGKTFSYDAIGDTWVQQ